MARNSKRQTADEAMTVALEAARDRLQGVRRTIDRIEREFGEGGRINWAKVGDVNRILAALDEVAWDGREPCNTALFGGDDARPIGGCHCVACGKAREEIR